MWPETAVESSSLTHFWELQRTTYMFQSLNPLANSAQILGEVKAQLGPSKSGVTSLPAAPSPLLWTSQMLTNHFPTDSDLFVRSAFWQPQSDTLPQPLWNDSRMVLEAHSKSNTGMLASCHHSICPSPLWELPPQKPLTGFHCHTS